MTDKRFEDRLCRIAEKHKNGPQIEFLAGEGDADTARAAAAPPSRPAPSLLLALLGAMAGLVALHFLHDQFGLELLLVMPPQMLAEIGVERPHLAAAAGLLALCALFTVTSFLRGRKAVRMLSFAGAATGAALGSAYTLLF